jgi:uncharacterized protein (TIGR02246 family)
MGVFFAVFLLSSPAAGPDTQELIRLEQQMIEALVRNDADAVAGLWGDDLLFVGTDGKASTKAQRLKGMASSASGGAVTAASNDDVKVRIYGQSAVVTLLSTWKVQVNSREFNDCYMTTHVWAKRHRRWLLVSAHVSKVTP